MIRVKATALMASHVLLLHLGCFTAGIKKNKANQNQSTPYQIYRSFTKLENWKLSTCASRVGKQENLLNRQGMVCIPYAVLSGYVLSCLVI